MASRSNLVRSIVEAAPAFDCTMETRQLLAHELFWDGSIEEIFFTHYIGGSVRIAMIPEIVSHIHDTVVATKANSVTLSPMQDCDIKFVAVGCVGEMFVSGPTVRLGYLGAPEATTRSFMMDPFRKDIRMYRTGDFGHADHEDFTSLDVEADKSD
ncbi:hypothetical protein M404DRAFT_33532 [Pisolithus tinctorius Marx 270]|uniref:Uncharacterized protein n=1 Tax=Pisolithus tinctorius Marx 270 TaxID=870435 RepID=A0A0C3NKD7_PISTI|nr:hypothetical protein M404DRAFT_33532 [Pisolithus tinctorius Marx 270]